MGFDFTSAAVATVARDDALRALREDVGPGDLTASLIDGSRRCRARVIARETTVLCGAPWVDAAVREMDPGCTIGWQAAEGDVCKAGATVLVLEGQARALLSVERTALNFMQMLSGVATKTRAYVDAIRGVPGSRAQIIDTRKTIPGLRLAQKYAVRIGGGANHRIGLYDAILIKENHIVAAGGVRAALRAAAAVAAKADFVQIEVETLAQLHEALDAGATMVLLDNMDLPTMREAVRINAERAVIEISGGVTLARLPELAATGVHRISVGALTKDVDAADFSMRFEEA